MPILLPGLLRLQTRFRARRELHFAHWVRRLARTGGQASLRVLDVGGYPGEWTERCKDLPIGPVYTLNLEARYPQPGLVRGDAIHLPFRDNAVDLVYCNSVIEHIPAQHQAACLHELCRVGTSLYLQTPNRHFWIEPHFCFPGFQFLPSHCRATIARIWPFSWYRAIPGLTQADAVRDARTISMVSHQQLTEWMMPPPAPGCWRLERETLLGFTKSFRLLRTPRPLAP